MQYEEDNTQQTKSKGSMLDIDIIV
jgi:hypothetical protein